MPPRKPKRRDAADRPPTLKALAEYLGLSPTTVSLVMNRSQAAASIPRHTQERVRAAAAELGYRPNFVARSLRSKRSFTVGVLVQEISEGYAAGVMSGVENHLLQAGYFYLVASHRGKPDLIAEYQRLFLERAVEGFILVNTPAFEKPPLPTVVVSGHGHTTGVTNVAIDHERAAWLALSHLAELGHERIAIFKGHAHSADTQDRWDAIQHAARRLQLKVLPELTLQLEGRPLGGVFSPEEGYAEGYAFGQRLLARRSAFTALFAFNDVSAIGAVRAFRDAGLHVPAEVSVVGFDDIHSAAFQNPSLTTVRQPLAQMGGLAARVLLDRLAGNSSYPDTLSVEPRLIVRESTAPARRAGTPASSGRSGAQRVS